MNIIFLAATVISAVGLIYIIYSRSIKAASRRLYVLALFLVIGYLISHTVHFLLMPSGDVTILDQSCHSFLLLIVLVLCFFTYYYPQEQNMPISLKAFLILPTLALIIMLWTGGLIMESHAHENHFMASYAGYYPVYLIWYVVLLLISIYFIVSKVRQPDLKEFRLPLLTILAGLIITNLAAFIFGLYLPWILGFYYLVEISPLSFLIGVILTTTIAITRFNMFPAAVSRIQSFTLNKKVFFAALIVVPIVILLIQVPLGRVLFDIQTSSEWQRYFLVSLSGGILVSVLMAFIISKIVADPINKLTEKTDEISQGNYGITVDITSNDELGKLARTFNNMSGVLLSDTRELKERQQRIDLLLNAFERSNAAICAFSPEGSILETNSQFAALLNDSKEKLVDGNIFELSETQVSLKELRNILNTFSSSGDYLEEITIDNADIKNYLVNISPFSSELNNTEGYFLIMVDITKIKKLESELAKSEKLAALGKLSAVLAHEIKTPLTSIKMNTDMLAESLSLGSDDKQSMQIINREIARLNNLVKEVLQYSRQVELNKSALNIKELIDEVEFQTKTKFEQKEFRVINNCDNLSISADKEKLKQVLLNIVDNAYEASSANGEVAIDAIEKNFQIELLLTDNGGGIDAEVRDKVFDPFFTSKPSGTGLGLAVARKIIEQHNGILELVESIPGRTVFKITLPIK